MGNRSRRMAPAQIAEDEEAFAALKAITGYAPSNPAYSLAAIEQSYQELQIARTVEVQADAAAKAAQRYRRGEADGLPRINYRLEGSGDGAVRKELEPGTVHRAQEAFGAESPTAQVEEGPGGSEGS